MLWGYMRHRICPADWSQALSSELNLEEGAAWKCEDTRGSRETVWCDWGGLEAERSERLDWICRQGP